ncbi:MAG: 50S ribosomal protein L21e [Candidatus Altiarchaeota archaeon]|nr:50S ribosomal protein L21e [Candidatus Altiarchaeota archaeon]
MKGSDGYRRRTRQLRITPKEKGKVRIRSVLASFSEKDKVSIKIDSRHQNIPHPRFNGRIGEVVGNQGRAYFVKFKEGKKEKTILVTPEHLRRI